MFDFSLSLSTTYTFWAGIIGGTTLTLGTHGTDQMMVQRYLCTAGHREAAKALVLSGFVVFFQFLLFLILGVALACFYQERVFESGDQVFATFIVEEMPVGLVGLTLAAVFSAAMSTLSSSLNSSATAVVNDFGSDVRSDQERVTLSRRTTVCFGLLQIAIGIGASFWSTSVVGDALAIAGFSAGIILGVFILGSLPVRCAEAAVVAAMSLAVLVLLLVHFLTDVAWPWYAPVGVCSTIVFGYLLNSVLPQSDPSAVATHIDSSHPNGSGS